ncbi:hypothetical protein ANCDUO_12587 [Ancylostoma duodenale]|uniref:Uncharacterized protein n=1 Tax=Ancylostoma duodenale TaxID=51022 RepID=A0A0C2CL12_9BILA|nr:hypothetical protein ANCDUO_12587 [Ancylostoma duodenale]
MSSNNYFRIQLTLPSEPEAYKDILDELDLDCKRIFEGDRNVIEQAKEWTYDTNPIEELLFAADDRIQLTLPVEPQAYKDILDEIDLDCKRILEGDRNAIEQAKEWTYDTNPVEEILLSADDRCRAIEELFGFNKKDVTPDELQYPLAYGAVVYKNFIQVLFMLSAFYRPHNEYCIAVSGSADKIFKFFMAQLGKCFSNIHIMGPMHKYPCE